MSPKDSTDSDSTSNDSASDSLTLILMRHAKSDWSDGSLSDHDRPLNKRGRRTAPLMAAWLEEIGHVPDSILSSSSTRTRETVDLLREHFGDVDVHFSQSLYLSSPDTILETVRSDGGEARCLMVVAHNPGMTHLASILAGKSVDMATAAMAVYEVNVSQWYELQSADECELIEFMRPKALDLS